MMKILAMWLLGILAVVIIVLVIHVTIFASRSGRETHAMDCLRAELANKQEFRRVNLLPFTRETENLDESYHGDQRSIMWAITGRVDSKQDVISLRQFLEKHGLMRRVELDVGVGTNVISSPYSVDDAVRFLQSGSNQILKLQTEQPVKK